MKVHILLNEDTKEHQVYSCLSDLAHRFNRSNSSFCRYRAKKVIKLGIYTIYFDVELIKSRKLKREGRNI